MDAKRGGVSAGRHVARECLVVGCSGGRFVNQDLCQGYWRTVELDGRVAFIVSSRYGTNRMDSTISPSSALMCAGVPGKYCAMISTRNPSTSMTQMFQMLSGPWT